MATLDNDEFDVFDDTTPPRSDAADGEQTREEKPAEPPAASDRPKRPAKSARTRTVAEVPVELDTEELGDWQWRLGASARKAVAARKKADMAERAWKRVVADARAKGVPERMLMAAALEADVDLPSPK
jgi:hypothetical protein